MTPASHGTSKPSGAPRNRNPLSRKPGAVHADDVRVVVDLRVDDRQRCEAVVGDVLGARDHAWCRRDLAGEDIVRLILDGTMVRVRVDRKATSVSLLVVLGIRRDGQKVLLAARSMGGESEVAWRAVLDDLVARGLRTPAFLIVDGAAGLEKALAHDAAGCDAASTPARRWWVCPRPVTDRAAAAYVQPWRAWAPGTAGLVGHRQILLSLTGLHHARQPSRIKPVRLL